MEKQYNEVDFIILNEVVKDPRVTLVRLSDALNKHSYNLSLESIRKRLEVLTKNINFLPLVNWRSFNMELYEFRIKINGGNESKNKIMEHLKNAGSFLCYDTFGETDITAFFLIKKDLQISEVLDKLRGLDEIRQIQHILITHNELFEKNLSKFVSEF